ncbi:hypothetical protein RUM44_007662 [Polyplax serrata]|uniref:Uncharacterized protein n=1 Tax=Polyplax serrata TaxID=468196 RepID=A0ABR1B716_POLSC
MIHMDELSGSAVPEFTADEKRGVDGMRQFPVIKKPTRRQFDGKRKADISGLPTGTRPSLGVICRQFNYPSEMMTEMTVVTLSAPGRSKSALFVICAVARVTGKS